MREISIKELYEFYIDTLEKCGTHLLAADDDAIAHAIFEEFDIGAVSFLHPDSLQKLYEDGYISRDKMNKSTLLRKKFLALQNSDEWNINAVRSSSRWRRVLKLSDRIKNLH